MSKQAKGCKSECQYWNSSSQIHSLKKKKKLSIEKQQLWIIIFGLVQFLPIKTTKLKFCKKKPETKPKLTPTDRF